MESGKASSQPLNVNIEKLFRSQLNSSCGGIKGKVFRVNAPIIVMEIIWAISVVNPLFGLYPIHECSTDNVGFSESACDQINSQFPGNETATCIPASAHLHLTSSTIAFVVLSIILVGLICIVFVILSALTVQKEVWARKVTRFGLLVVPKRTFLFRIVLLLILFLTVATIVVQILGIRMIQESPNSVMCNNQTFYYTLQANHSWGVFILAVINIFGYASGAFFWAWYATKDLYSDILLRTLMDMKSQNIYQDISELRIVYGTEYENVMIGALLQSFPEMSKSQARKYVMLRDFLPPNIAQILQATAPSIPLAEEFYN